MLKVLGLRLSWGTLRLRSGWHWNLSFRALTVIPSLSRNPFVPTCHSEQMWGIPLRNRLSWGTLRLRSGWQPKGCFDFAQHDREPLRLCSGWQWSHCHSEPSLSFRTNVRNPFVSSCHSERMWGISLGLRFVLVAALVEGTLRLRSGWQKTLWLECPIKGVPRVCAERLTDATAVKRVEIKTVAVQLLQDTFALVRGGKNTILHTQKAEFLYKKCT